MYATNRLPGFEFFPTSIVGMQSTQISGEASSEVQKLLDGAIRIGENYRRPALEKALNAAIAVKDYPGIDVCIHYLDNWFRNFADERAGYDFFQKVLVRAQSLRDYRLQYFVLKYLSFKGTNQDTDKEEAELTKMMAFARRYATDFEIIDCLQSLGFFYKRLGDTEKSDELLNEALLYARRIGDFGTESSILFEMVQNYRDKGNIERAISLNEDLIRVTKGKVGNGVGQMYDSALINRVDFAKIKGEKTVELQSYIDLVEREKSKGTHFEYVIMWMDDIAQFHKQNGNLLKCIAVRSEILALWHKTGFKWKIAEATAELCVAYDDYGDIKNAVPLLLEAVELCWELGKHQSLSQLGNLYQKGFTVYETTLEKFRVGGDIPSQCSVMVAMARLLRISGESDRAMSLVNESLLLSRKIQDKSCICSALQTKSMMISDSGKNDDLLPIYNELLKLRREIGDRDEIVKVLDKIIDFYYGKGDFNQALRVGSESLTNLRIVGSKYDQAACLNKIASIHVRNGSFRAAKSALDEAYELSRSLGVTQVLGDNRLLYADFMNLMGRHDVADSLCDQAQLIFQKPDDYIGRSRVAMLRGDELLAVGKFERAKEEYERASFYLTEKNLPDDQPQLRIGIALFEVGRNLEATIALKRFVKNCQSSGQDTGLSRALTVLGRALIRKRQFDAANTSLLRAVAVAERTGDTNDLADAFRHLSELTFRQGNLRGAILFGKRGIDARQLQRAGTAGLDVQIRTSFTSRIAPDYRRLAELYVLDGRVSESDQVLSLLKETELNSATPSVERRETVLPRSRADSDGELAYQQASAETVALGARLRILELAKQPSKEVLDERANLLKRLELAEKSFAKEMDRIVAEARSSGLASRAEVLQGSEDGISKSLLDLPEGTAALSMLWLEDRVRLILTTPSVRVIRTSMVDARTLGKRILAFREVLTDPSKDPLPASRSLYEILWKPVAPDIAKLKISDVLLSLDGPVRYIPLGALHDGRSFLAERLRLSLFSPTERDRITQRPSNRWDVLFAGVSNSRTVDDGLGAQVSFSNLPGVRDEARRVRAVLAGGPPTVLDGGFDLQSLRTGLLARPKVVHLASHFLLRSGSESESFLLTGKGDVLRISDSQTLSTSLFRSVDLLTLSACQTGMTSETADGREVESIATVFQRKGASAVLSTLWPVADASTAAFMGTFYTLRAQDPRRTKTWCLREAQVRMIRGEVAPPGAPKPVSTRGTTSIKVSAKGLRKDWSHPYHWAPFILQGNPL